MLVENFNDKIKDFMCGYIEGAKTVNNSYKSFASEELRSGSGKPMAIYRNNKQEIEKIEYELEQGLVEEKHRKKKIL